MNYKIGREVVDIDFVVSADILHCTDLIQVIFSDGTIHDVINQNRTFNIDTPLGREAFRYLKDTFSIDTHSYDAICGYRADDSYFSFAQDFINGAISYQQLRAAMYLGEMGEQFVIVSERAFAQLRYKRCEKAMRGDWLFKKLERDRKARTEYLTSDRFKYQKGGLYVATILDEEIKPGDKRLT